MNRYTSTLGLACVLAPWATAVVLSVLHLTVGVPL